MFGVERCEHPSDSFLGIEQEHGAYTDCYFVDIDGQVSLGGFVTAFYTTPLFRIERAILSLLLSKPSTDAEAAHLDQGTSASFAIWTVEKRDLNQLLLAEFTGRTKSWFMVKPGHVGSGATTRLFFGSAVIPKKRGIRHRRSMGAIFHALLGFHNLYSRLLLASAKATAGRLRK